jgi:hypothetical protein
MGDEFEVFLGPHILHCVGGPLDGDEYKVPGNNKPLNIFVRHYHLREFGDPPRLAWYTGDTWCGTQKGDIPGYNDLPIYGIRFIGETEIGCTTPPEEEIQKVVEVMSSSQPWFEKVKRLFRN